MDNEEQNEQDFLRSDYCGECGGEGHIEGEQCEECEHLHRLELRADILLDEWKGN